MNSIAEKYKGTNRTGLRSPDVVMKLDRLGSLFPNRLSFSRTLVRRMARENWTFSRPMFDLDDQGIGIAVYQIETPSFPLWFVVFANNLDPKDRTDRVIAESWDTTFTLTMQAPCSDKLTFLKNNVPQQEVGRFSPDEIILSRANKSVRLFDYIEKKLASGEQPEESECMKVGYLMRTTAVYGNGKFGLADFENVKQQGLFTLPFEAEMLCVYLARNFSFDWVEHIAKKKSPKLFRPLQPHIKRSLGIGNATGLGMAPFLVYHPKLISNWMLVREEALRRIKSVKKVTHDKLTKFKKYIIEAKNHVDEWPTTDEQQKYRLASLKHELKNIPPIDFKLTNHTPWEKLTNWATKSISLEAQEILNSLLIEIYPELVDKLENETGSKEIMNIEPNMTLSSLKHLIEQHYSWVTAIDLETEQSYARFWYRSEEKEEPRLGWRYLEPGSNKEMRLGIAQNVKALCQELEQTDLSRSELTVGSFLIKKPKWRELIQRIQSLKEYPYAEIRDNLLDGNCRPIDLLRCKLAMFGATKFDPKSDLWIRIALFQGAPLSDELDEDIFDDWLFPNLQNSP